jgi:biotin carboxylase
VPTSKRSTSKNDQQRLLLIAPHSSYRITPYIQAARKLGVEVLIASTSEHSLVSEVAEGLRIDLEGDIGDPKTLEPILKAHDETPFTGVIATDDSAVTLAACAASALGLPHNPPEAVQLTYRKDLARSRLNQHEVPVPEHRRIDLFNDVTRQAHELFYPCVLKPLNLSGSRGVIRADNPQQCIEACKRIKAIISDGQDDDSRHYVLAERYIPGLEVALEGMLHQGKLEVLALFDKPDPMEGPYFEETYYISPSRLPASDQELMTQTVTDACKAYGLVHGPIHAELRLHNGVAWIMEIAARTIGGQCAQLLRHGTGYGLEELVISQSTGNSLPYRNNSQAAGVLMIPIPAAGILRRVEGLAAARRVPFITNIEISVRDGYELVPLPEGSAYLGFIFAQGPNPASVESALRESHAQLNFITAPLWKFSMA